VTTFTAADADPARHDDPMPQLRLALAQVDTTVGDLAGNADIVLGWCRRAADAGADVALLAEMVLTGYPVEDLALRESFATASRRELDALPARLAEAGLGELLVVAGYLDLDDAGPRNAAAIIHRGEIVDRYFKHHLPNDGVFDEFRYFSPGDALPVVRFRGVDLGVVICEDIWQDGGPVAAYGELGLDLLLCLNGSPYERAKDDARGELVAQRAREAGAPMAYVNLVGAQDELVFDGDSMVVDASGALLARAPQFVEHLLVVDLDLAAGRARSDADEVAGFAVRRSTLPGEAPADRPPLGPPARYEPLPDEAELWWALRTGLGDYVRKNGFGSVVLGLSGGIDSAVAAALAVDALGPDAVYGVSMPSKYSSEHSKGDAADMAERTGLHYSVQPIGEMVEAFVSQLSLTGLAEENVQARCRGVTLMALSNAEGHLVLATGNKTELAVGYSTIYGDAVGGFAPLKDVPKTLVWQLARWRNEQAEKNGETLPIPPNSIEKPPSAELRPGQLDTDSLPDYALLDDVLDDYVESDRGYADLVAAGFDPAVIEDVVQKVDRAEYKRRQYPPGTKISPKGFGRDRRLPITNSWREKRP
jgi:NAD+ synthase (glutamine-hydrolysing)